MTVDQTLIPDADSLTEEQTLARVQQLGWSKIEFRSLFRMMFNLSAMKMLIPVQPAIFHVRCK